MMSRLKDLLRAHLPESLLAILRALRRAFQNSFLGRWILPFRLWRTLRYNYCCDARRYWEHGMFGVKDRTRANLRANIILVSHCIEKGLSHPSPRLKFGQRHIDKLLADVPEYVAKYGHDATTAIGLDTLTSYCRMHEQQGARLEELESALSKMKSDMPLQTCRGEAGGAFPVLREEIHAAGKMDLEPFLKSRHSIRHFDARPVESELIEKAVSLAITTPSVCNRQAWKARVFRDSRRKQAVLAMQNGNRGFSEEIDTLILVTCDLQCFMSVGERNQAWIDGGMFAMTLTLALHSLGLGACCLNWSVDVDQDRALRRLIHLPEEEVVVLMIAVGHIPERLSVARSTRKTLDEVLVWNDP